MTSKLYEKVKDRDVYTVLKATHYKLGILKPDAKIVHRKGNMMNLLSMQMNFREDGTDPKEETFSEYMERDQEFCESALEDLARAASDFGILI